MTSQTISHKAFSLLILHLFISSFYASTGPYYLDSGWHDSNPIIAIIHSRASLGGVLSFIDSTPPEYPRIQGAYLAEEVNSTRGSVTPKDFKVTESNVELTISWINAEIVTAPLDDTDLGLAVSPYNHFDFPTTDQSNDFDLYSNPGSVSVSEEDQTYIYKHFYVDTQEEADLNCTFTVQLTGSMRGVYLNDVKLTYIGTNGGVNAALSASKTFNFNYDAILKGGMLNVVTLIASAGTSFSNFEFGSCDDPATLVYYVSDNEPIDIGTIWGPTTPTLSSPSFPVSRIQDEDEPISCSDDYYWQAYSCVQICDGYAHFDHVCSKNQYSTFLQSSTVQSDSIEVDLYFDFAPNDGEAVIFLATNTPNIQDNQPYIIFSYRQAVETPQLFLQHTNVLGQTGTFLFPVKKFDSIDASIIIMDKYRGEDKYYYFVSHTSGNWQEYFKIGEYYTFTDQVKGYFFVGCLEPPCNIIITGTGFLEFIVDGKRKFYSELGIGFKRVIEIEDDWTEEAPLDYNYKLVRFANQGTMGLKIDITGNWDGFAPGPIQGEVELNPLSYDQIDCSSYSGCQACNGTQCTLCNFAYEYIDVNGDCVDKDSCDPSLAQRNTQLCASSCGDGYRSFASECVLECPPGTYENAQNCQVCEDGCVKCVNGVSCASSCQIGEYEEEDGCHSCPTGCEICDATNTCYRCEDHYTLNINGECLVDYSYEISAPDYITLTDCGDQTVDIFVKRIHPETLAEEFLTITQGFAYYIEEINTENSTYFTELDTQLQTFEGDTFIFLDGQLQLGTTMVISYQYFATNELPKRIGKKYVTLSVYQGLYAYISQGSNYVTFQNQILTLNGQATTCGTPQEEIVFEWSQTSGPQTDFDSPTTSQSIEFDACYFEFGETYQFTITATDETYEMTDDYTISIFVNQESPNFDVIIYESNFDHRLGEELTLTGALILNTELCPGTEIGEYLWSCTNNGEECSDSGVFGYSDSPNITIPGSYFENEGDEVNISLSVQIGYSQSEAVSTISVVGEDDLSIQISCNSTSSCAKYVNEAGYTFSAVDIYGSVNVTDLEFEWIISDPSLVSITFFNSLKLLKSVNQLTEPLIIEVIVTNPANSNSARASITLLPNESPDSGTLQVTPTSGQALSTEFTILASGWQDDDLPLSYQFSYTKPSNPAQRSPIGKKQLSNQVTTILPGGSQASTTLTIYVRIFDALSATTTSSTTVVVSTSFGSVNEVNSAIGSLVNSLAGLEPTVAVEKIKAASNTLVGQEETFKDTATDEEVGEFINSKKLLLQSLKDVATSIATDEEGRQSVIDTLQSSSVSVKFNSNETQAEVQEILESIVDMDNDKDLVSEENSELITDILDNFVSYSAETDCSLSTNFTADLESRTIKYLEKSSRSNLANLVPNQDPIIKQGSNYDILTIKARPVDLDQIQIQTQPNSPLITFKPDLSIFDDPEEQFEIQYYVFKSNIFGCDAEEEEDGGDVESRLLSEQITNRGIFRRLQKKRNLQSSEEEEDSEKKDFMAFQFKDKNGEIINSGVPFEVQPVEEQECPEGCDCSDPDNYECEDIGFFDVGGQISKIFADSNLNKLENIGILLSFPFWETITFWGIIVFTIWFVVSIVIIHRKLKNYCSLKEFLESQTKTRKKALIVLLLITHPLLGVYYYIDPKIVKFQRVFLYYTRLMLVLAYTSLFEDISPGIDLNPYIIMFPYITYMPLMFLLEILVEIDSESASKKTKLAKCLKFKSYTGLFLCFCTIIGCYIILLTISAQQDSETRRLWALNFAIVVFLDVILTPIGSFGFQFLLYRCLYTKRKKRLSKRAKKIADSLIGEPVLKVMNEFKEMGKHTVIVKGKKAAIAKGQTEEDIAPYNEEEEDIPPQKSSQSVSKENEMKVMTVFTTKAKSQSSPAKAHEDSKVIDQYLEGDEIDENFVEDEVDVRKIELDRGVARDRKKMEQTQELNLKMLTEEDIILEGAFASSKQYINSEQSLRTEERSKMNQNNNES